MYLNVFGAALCVALMLGTTGARAAGGSEAAPIAAKQPSWNGCYVGVIGGFAMPNAAEGGGIAGGGQVGCDVQLERVVVGMFGDWVRHGGELRSNEGDLTWSLGSQWTVGGRVGYVWKDVLVYGMAGYTRLTYGDVGGAALATPIAMDAKSGAMLGLGAEMALGHGFFVGLEYRYSHFGMDKLMVAGNEIDLDSNVHAVMGRLTYKMDTSALSIPAGWR